MDHRPLGPSHCDLRAAVDLSGTLLAALYRPPSPGSAPGTPINCGSIPALPLELGHRFAYEVVGLLRGRAHGRGATKFAKLCRILAAACLAAAQRLRTPLEPLGAHGAGSGEAPLRLSRPGFTAEAAATFVAAFAARAAGRLGGAALPGARPRSLNRFGSVRVAPAAGSAGGRGAHGGRVGPALAGLSRRQGSRCVPAPVAARRGGSGGMVRLWRFAGGTAGKSRLGRRRLPAVPRARSAARKRVHQSGDLAVSPGRFSQRRGILSARDRAGPLLRARVLRSR